MNRVTEMFVLVQAAKGPPEPQRLWDERSGKCLADFFNNLRADTLVVEMSAEEGRRLSTSDLILLLQVGL